MGALASAHLVRWSKENSILRFLGRAKQTTPYDCLAIALCQLCYLGASVEETSIEKVGRFPAGFECVRAVEGEDVRGQEKVEVGLLVWEDLSG